jgi:hypothetical protein
MEQEMKDLLGFCTFETTRGKAVEGNKNTEAAKIIKKSKRKYRQFLRKSSTKKPVNK